MPTGDRMTRDDFASMLGEGFHTAFRKGLDTPAAVTIWRLIDDMPPPNWAAVIEFVVSGFPDSFTVEDQA